MTREERELLGELVVESLEHLQKIEPDLLTLEREGSSAGGETVNRVFRAIHSIKGGFGFFGVEPVQALAHVMESALMPVRDGKAVATPTLIDALLTGVDRLTQMLADIDAAAGVDARAVFDALERVLSGEPAASEATTAPPPAAATAAVPPSAATPAAKPARPRRRKTAPPAGEVAVTTPPSPIPIAPAAIAPQAPFPVSDPAPTRAAGTPAAPSAAPAKAPDAPPAEPAAIERHVQAGQNESLRVKVDLLDRLMNLAGELVLARNQLLQGMSRKFSESAIGDAWRRTLETGLADLQKNLLASLGEQKLGSAQREAVQRAVQRLQSEFEHALGQRLAQLPGVATPLAGINHVTSQLQESIMRTRMQPLAAVFGKMPRQIRELAKVTGKEIQLEVSGDDVELDRSIVEGLNDPLTHLLRNSADHGFESPGERQGLGKPRAGQLAVRAFHEGGQVTIEIADDGRGIDAAKLRAKAVAKGLISADAAARMDEREALRLIFAPGFSTAEKITEVSGRGVGMDVVRNNIESLGGSIDIATQVGRGTTISLRLPLTLAIIPSLIVRVGPRRYAVPQVNIEELVRLRAGDERRRIERLPEGEVLRLRGELLPLARLGTLIGVPGSTDEARDVEHVLILGIGGHRYALAVDRIEDNEEIVVKPLPALLHDVPCYGGATIMGDGRVAMILDAASIAERAGLHFAESEDAASKDQAQRASRLEKTESQSLLLFRNHPEELFGINLTLVSRIERVAASEISHVGDKEFLNRNGSALRLVRLHHHMPVAAPSGEPAELTVIVPKLVRHPLGIVASSTEDVVHTRLEIERQNIHGTGILGSALVGGRLTVLLDIYSLFEAAAPELYGHDGAARDGIRGLRVLWAEDTPFFRTLVGKYLAELGCHVTTVSDGEEAWAALNQPGFQVDIVVTDVEMPGMNGLELTRQIRASARHAHLPVLALTALGSEAMRDAGARAGVTAWEVKLDKERLGEAVRRLAMEIPAHA